MSSWKNVFFVVKNEERRNHIASRRFFFSEPSVSSGETMNVFYIFKWGNCTVWILKEKNQSLFVHNHSPLLAHHHSILCLAFFFQERTFFLQFPTCICCGEVWFCEGSLSLLSTANALLLLASLIPWFFFFPVFLLAGIASGAYLVGSVQGASEEDAHETPFSSYLETQTSR